MDEKWTIETWRTPVSETRGLTMVELRDTRVLELVVEAVRDEGRPRWRFLFHRYMAYRNVLEEFRNALWKHLDETAQRCGATFIVKSSAWIEELEQTEAILQRGYPDLRHYVVVTEDDVLEVLSSAEVVIEPLGPTASDVPIPGKSRVFHVPEDGRDAAEVLAKASRRGGGA